MTSLTNEVAALKTKVANLESKQNDYATKSELASAIDDVKGLLEALRRQIESTIDTLRNLIEDLIRRLFGLESNGDRIKNLEIRVSALEFITNSLRRTIEAVRNRLDKLESAFYIFKGVVAAQISQIFGRLQSLENTVGQILMDIRNIYNILTKLKKDFDGFVGWVRLEFFKVWAEIIKINIALLALSFLLVLKNKIDKLLSLIEKVQEIFKLINQLRKLFNNKNNQRGLPGRSGRDGRDGQRGLPGRNGEKGADGKNGRDGKDAKVEFSTINAPVFDSCKPDGSGANFVNQSIQVIKGTEIQEFKKFEQIAKVREQECIERNAIAALPEHWQVQIGADRPQLVVLFAEVLPNGKLGRSRFPIAIPHYNKSANFRPNIPAYTKGNYMGILVLKDNSKITVNASSISEAERVINTLSSLVNPALLTGAKPKVGPRGGEPIANRFVKATSASFFATGRKDLNPTWVISL